MGGPDLVHAVRFGRLGGASAAAFPIIFAIFATLRRNTGTAGELWPLYGLAVIMAVLVIYRHRATCSGFITASSIGLDPRPAPSIVRVNGNRNWLRYPGYPDPDMGVDDT